MSSPPRPALADVLAVLRKTHPEPAPHALTDPFELVIWEACAFLAGDPERRAVFTALRKATKLDPKKLLAVPDKKMLALLEPGGLAPRIRLDRIRKSSKLALEIGLDTLRKAAKNDPRAARKLLKRFPGVADPGVDRILMFAGSLRALGPESNGVRVLNRLGFGELTQDWTRAYRTAAKAVEPELPRTRDALVEAHHLIRRHGRDICKASRPACVECPLRERCAHGAKIAPAEGGAAAWETMHRAYKRSRRRASA